MENENAVPMDETPEERACRLTEKIRGILKDEIAEFGGAEAFIRWVRSDHDRPVEASDGSNSTVG